MRCFTTSATTVGVRTSVKNGGATAGGRAKAGGAKASGAKDGGAKAGGTRAGGTTGGGTTGGVEIDEGTIIDTMIASGMMNGEMDGGWDGIALTHATAAGSTLIKVAVEMVGMTVTIAGELTMIGAMNGYPAVEMSASLVASATSARVMWTTRVTEGGGGASLHEEDADVAHRAPRHEIRHIRTAATATHALQAQNQNRTRHNGCKVPGAHTFGLYAPNCVPHILELLTRKFR